MKLITIVVQGQNLSFGSITQMTQRGSSEIKEAEKELSELKIKATQVKARLRIWKNILKEKDGLQKHNQPAG